MITANHKFISTKPEQSDSTIIGPNEWNATHNIVDNSNIFIADDYNFSPRSPGGSLIIGSNPIVLNPLPLGLAIGGNLYISGGTGSAEAALITGITGNTVSVTCANTHTGSWTVKSASGGLQEAIAIALAAGSKVIITKDLTLNANVVDLGKHVIVEKFPGITINNASTFSIYATIASDMVDREVYTAKASELSYKTSGPDWPTNFLNYSALMMNVNNYPNYYFGNDTMPVPEAIRGSISVPANAATGAQGTAVAGYALTNSTNMSALGIYGFASSNVDNTSSFAGNFVVSNRKSGPTSIGTDSATCYGIEIDVNIMKKADGNSPVHLTKGLFITGGSDAPPSASSRYTAIVIESPGVFQTPKLKWGTALRTEDGSCVNSLDIGCIDTGNNTGSQPVFLRSRDTSGVNRTAQILTDPGGNLVLLPGSNAELVLADSNLNIAAAVNPLGSTPYLNVPYLVIGQVNIPATAASPGIRGNITWDANFIYMCIATNTWKRVAIATW